MKVIFLEDVAGTADAGDVKVVKNGFARNFLLPRNLAAPATPDQLQRLHAIQKTAQEKRLKFSEEWSTVAKALDGTVVTVEVRVGPSGRLFGAVTGRQIAQKLSEATGREIDHRQVLLGTSIHDPGDYSVGIRLYREVQATITVSVIPEGYVAPEDTPLPDTELDSAQTEGETGTTGMAESDSIEDESQPAKTEAEEA